MDQTPPQLPPAANLEPPLKLASVKLSGFAASHAKPGEYVRVWARYAATSDQHIFHLMAEGLVSTLQEAARASGHNVKVQRASSILAVIRPDETADLYLDSVAQFMSVRLKRAVVVGQAVMANDLTDILSVSFPAVALQPSDRVIFLFREGFRFGFCYDLTGELDQAEMEKAIGGLMRQLKHHEAYAALNDPAIFSAMSTAGWFPFIEMHGGEFARLYTAFVEQRELEKVEELVVSAFTRDRLEEMFARWMAHTAFKGREGLLRPGLEAYIDQKPVLAIKTLLTEIEGILQEANVKAANESAKTPGLVAFVVAEASRKAGGTDTLFFPEAFQQYLMENVYRSFDPKAGDAPAWRHAAAHGAAPADAYTVVRALQVILTLDQLSTYLV